MRHLDGQGRTNPAKQPNDTAFPFLNGTAADVVTPILTTPG
ncbi:MAG: hypothetical protein WDN49_13610 [Acetobacteraceae bacterium]